MSVLLSKSPQPAQRGQLEAALLRHEQTARDAAESGDIEASARSILALLDCERRLGAQGPQVMQVIKPRNANRGQVS